jgi:hypothetical protein
MRRHELIALFRSATVAWSLAAMHRYHSALYSALVPILRQLVHGPECRCFARALIFGSWTPHHEGIDSNYPLIFRLFGDEMPRGKERNSIFPPS